MNTFIYALCDPRDLSVRYIGKANNPILRLRTHKNEALNKHRSHKCNWIRALLKEGLYPELFVIDEVSLDDWEFWEIFYIDLFKSFGFDLTNAESGGKGPNRISEESRKKMSDAKKGKYVSIETRRKMSLAGKGKSKPEGFGEKSSKRQKGKKLSIEHIERMRLSLTGKYSRENSPFSKNFEIYDNNGNLRYKFIGDFLGNCKEQGLPGRTLQRSYLSNGSKIFNSNISLGKIRDEQKAFIGWYAIRTSN